MSGVNAVELKVVGWLKGERERGSQVWALLREIAEGEDEFEYGDHELGNWLADLLDSEHTQHADIILADKNADLRAVRELRKELAGIGDDPAGWLDQMDPMVIRVFLLQINDDDALYVHPLVGPYLPEERPRVSDERYVYAPMGGLWTMPAEDRQICDEPISRPCSCRIERREHGA